MIRVALARWKKDEKGEGVFTFLIGILIFMILTLLAVSIYQSYAISRNLDTATSEILSTMKFENGADWNTRNQFNDLVQRLGLDPNKVTYSATPKTVQRGEVIEVKASYPYKVFALKAIGVDYEIQISSKSSGLAHKFIR